MNSLHKCGDSLSSWSRMKFGYLPQLIRKKQKKLESYMNAPNNRTDNERLQQISNEIADLLHKEAIFWWQRAKVDILTESDANTRSFHAKASTRKRKNYIAKLRREDGSWADSFEDISLVISNYFQNIFQSTNPEEVDIMLDGLNAKVTDADNNLLLSSFHAGEIREALFQMDPRTAPGLDVDFTLAELKSLKVKQRYPFRDQQFNGKLPIITFEEFIAIALDADQTVGIYPEIKNPVLINQQVKWKNGKKFEDKFVETLMKYGYKGAYMSKDWLKQPVFIQSFAPNSLIYTSNLTDSPKVLLIDDVTIPTQDTDQSYWEITSDEYLAFIKEYVVGIGPWKDTIVPVENNYLATPSDLVAKAHAHDLQVHPYTFRNENQFLHLNFHQDPYAEYEFWINKIEVDGLFTDFTGSLHRYQEWRDVSQRDESSASGLLHKIQYMISSFNKGV